MSITDPAVDAVLKDLVASIRTVLGTDIVAIYLYGSYVTGGFDPGVSDLDLVAVSSAEIKDLDLVSIEQMHRDIVGRHHDWDDRIEVVYIGRATLEAFRMSAGRLAVISPGEPFHVRDDPPAEWVQNWYLVRETGTALYGPPAPEVVPHVDTSEFLAATVRYAGQLSRRSLRDASPGDVAYAVLTMCRAVTTVRTQGPVSKQAGADRALREFPEWAWLVDAALQCRLARGAVGFTDQQTRAAATAFIRLLAAEITRPQT